MFGSGEAGRLAAHAGPAAGETILVVTDPGIRRLGLADQAIASLEAAGARVLLFDQVEPDPSRATLDAAIDMALAAGAVRVIGFGGGSSLDVAKLVALVAGSGESLDDAWGVSNARGPRLPLTLVPTTAGTGSEVTPVAIITVGAEEKRGVSSPLLVPDLAILDPALTLGLPAPITAATGIDAMVHAIEAHVSANANNNPVSRMLAREALRLLGANIEAAVADGSDEEARGAM
ncbi:MAG: iron-containing alcohol dehydrogenase, partial [Rhizobiaceae bacterium]